MALAPENPSAPRPDSPANRGLYLFLVRRTRPLRIKVGALGWHDFQVGWYIYTGRARRNLYQRVQRHWSPRKRVRWHIDYLSSAPGSQPVGAVILCERDEPALDECRLNQQVGTLFGADSPVPGFGASDCMSGCPSHLWYLEHPVSLLEIARVSPHAALLLPRGKVKAREPSADWPFPAVDQVGDRSADE